MKQFPKFPPTKYDYMQFDGGFDLDTPPLQIQSGYSRRAQNIELGVNGGYKRTVGYECFDGRPKPSDATYAILTATITGSYAVGNTLTGVTSGATAVIAAATSTYFVVTKVVGTFQAENLQISAVTIAVSSDAQAVGAATTSKLNAQYLNAAADIYRADITAVPGSGSILGVVQYNDIVYAFRNNAGATAAAIYKSAVGGWTAVALGRSLSFTSGGTYVIAEGNTITGATSAATAVVTRVALTSGTFAAGTAAGVITFASQAGTFQAENLDVGANLNVATIAGNSAAITLTAGGRYEFVIENFGGATGTKRIYGCSGVQRGFEFDGTVYVPITTGMTTDTPTFLAVHKKHLFFSFGSSAQHSGIGTPYIWTPISGAAELAQGDTITGFKSQPGSETSKGALTILSRNRVSVLYGSSSADWELVTYGEEQGAYAYSVERIGTQILMLDDRGLTSVSTSASYGNFVTSTISQRFQSWLKDKRSTVIASCISRDNSQWRIFFSSGYALYVTFNGNKHRGSMPMLFPDAVTCIHSSERSDGSEAIYFGSDDGFVYQMEKGTSFDGDNIEAFANLVFNPSGTVRQRKRYKHAMLEVAGERYAELSIGYELGYASTEMPQPSNQDVVLSLTAAYWDSFVWDQFYWDGQALTPSEISIDGSAENISLAFTSNSDYFGSTTLSGAILHYIPRRALR